MFLCLVVCVFLVNCLEASPDKKPLLLPMLARRPRRTSQVSYLKTASIEGAMLMMFQSHFKFCATLLALQRVRVGGWIRTPRTAQRMRHRTQIGC